MTPQPAPQLRGAQGLGFPASPPLPHSETRSSALLLKEGEQSISKPHHLSPPHVRPRRREPNVWAALSRRTGAFWRHKPTLARCSSPKATETVRAASASTKAAREDSQLRAAAGLRLPSAASQLPRDPALPKGHPSLCLVKLPIIKWHVQLMIKSLHQEHERLRRTN